MTVDPQYTDNSRLASFLLNTPDFVLVYFPVLSVFIFISWFSAVDKAGTRQLLSAR